MTTSTAPPTDPAADGDSGTGTGFCRVQIAAPATRVDLALPIAVPLAALLPAILGYAEQDPAASHGWVLSRLDGHRLDPAAGLAAAGIREGELLLLHPAQDGVGEPLYDDVVEVLGEGATEGAWASRDTRTVCAVFAVLAVLGAVAAAAAAGGVLAGVLLGVLALLLLTGGGAVARAGDDLPAGTVLGALAAVAGAVAGVVLLGPPTGAAHLVLAAAVVALVAAAGPPVLGGGDAVFLGIGVVAGLGLLGGLLALIVPTTPARAAAVVAPLALALTTTMPTLALRLSRIPRPPLPRTAADLADVPGQLELDRVQDRVRHARGLLSGLLLGCYAVAAVGSVVLIADTATVWPAVLAAVLGILLVLRARLFRRRAQVGAPLAAAVAVLGAGLLAATSAAPAAVGAGPSAAILLGAVAPVALLLAGVAAAVGLRDGQRVLNPRVARGLDLLETLLLLAVVPIVLAVWDVYTLLLELRA